MDMKLSHAEDVRVFRSASGFVSFCVLAALLVVAPLVLPGYRINLLNTIAIYVVVALGLNILVGYTGQISLGHAAFLAIGGYVSVLLVARGAPFLAAMMAGGVVAAAFGFLLGLPALRMEGPYLTIATLGFGIATQQILGRFDFTGGHMGLHTAPLSIFGIELRTDAGRYALIVPIAVLCVLAAYNITRSRVGRAFTAVRDSDVAAASTGVNLTYYKTLAFAVSAFFTGVAGSMLAHSTGFIAPENFDLFLSIKLLAMVVVGGLGSILGSVLGATLLTIVEQTLSGYREAAAMIFGAVMIAVVLFEPLGLRGRWLKIKIYWKTWPF
ncbi:branched-chain amino acid ABC transporter permease [bacterium]|nr:branched-chain amino acid ABC transporter permease [bacterium]